MSGPASNTNPSGGGKDDGISKYMRRMKTVLKSGSRSNRASVSSMGEITGDSGKSGTKAAATSSSAKPAASAQAPQKTTSARKTTSTSNPTRITAQRWNEMQEERARALFEKYGLTLEPNEWITRPITHDVERVNKPVRMRIRRNCHRCLTQFGPDNLCAGCHHIRCWKCFRYPPPKSQDPKYRAAAGTTGAAGASKGKERVQSPTEHDQKRQKLVLTVPSKTGGPDLVRRPVRMRIRRNCHLCNTLFVGESTECENCHHIRCRKCPRDPPKLDKYPNGYPGDVDPPVERQQRVFRRPRRRVRWTCHSCNTLFHCHDRICPSCQHERCKDCIRDPPKRAKPEPDPDVLRRVEERLAKLDVSS